MEGEVPFRLAVLIVAAVQGGVSIYYVTKSGATSTIFHRREESVALTVPLVTSYLAYCLAVIVYLIEPAWVTWSALTVPLWLRWAGLVFVLLGGGLILWSLRSLGSNLTFVPATKDNHTLVMSGPYGWVRHPIYTAFLMQSVGIGLLIANWFAGVAGLATWGLLAVRTGQEEQKLIERFGDAYRAYAAQVGQFFPRLSRKG